MYFWVCVTKFFRLSYKVQRSSFTITKKKCTRSNETDTKSLSKLKSSSNLLIRTLDHTKSLLQKLVNESRSKIHTETDSRSRSISRSRSPPPAIGDVLRSVSCPSRLRRRRRLVRNGAGRWRTGTAQAVVGRGWRRPVSGCSRWRQSQGGAGGCGVGMEQVASTSVCCRWRR
jgi:hypothetical protein